MTQSQTGFADINGTKIYYEVAGEGEALVMVHAGICDSRMWDAQFPVFAEQYKTVRWDMRGFGKSALADVEYSHRDDLFDLLNHLKIDKAHLIGCSLGGGQIVDFALVHPENVASLTMVCSNPNGFTFEGEESPLWKEIVAAFEAGDLERAADLDVHLWAVGHTRKAEDVDQGMRDLVREMDLIALKNEKLGVGTYQSLQPRAAGRMDEIRVPVLIIVGEFDEPELTGRAADLMMETFPNARKKVLIKNAAHLPSMERPDEFNRHVLEFLKTVDEKI
jgi:pimeloyl-ACP methyl ester carboxylesterase